MKNIFVIVGSASKNSTCKLLVESFIAYFDGRFNFTVYEDLKKLPHFDPELTIEKTPQPVIEFRENIEKADGLLICTPEYVFSIPSGLKNAIEWCVSTTVFTDKPTALVTASLGGAKAHEELQLIMQTVMAKFSDDTVLLISGIKSKIDLEGQFQDTETKSKFEKCARNFERLLSGV